MNTFAKFSLFAAAFITTLAAQAGGVRGYVRSNGTYVAPHYRSSGSSLSGSSVGAALRPGYVYRNPYAADPSVNVRGYTRDSGMVVMPYRRTPANETLTDNLNYRGFGTIREPRYLNGLK